MSWFFKKKFSIAGSGILQGRQDCHCHLVYGVDDGVKVLSEALDTLEWMEQGLGLKEVWFTPHIMEDYPNTTESLKQRFKEICQAYDGSLRLHLAAEYMLDELFERRLEAEDLLLHRDGGVLVETSTLLPPINLWKTLDRIIRLGYKPILAHPERYLYMGSGDYSHLHEMGVTMQLNLPSCAGFYGRDAQEKASYLLDKGWYGMAGSDCHNLSITKKMYSSKALEESTIRKIAAIA